MNKVNVEEQSTLSPPQAELLKSIKVIDCDTHYTEPHDLWTSRVPAKFKELMPHVVRNAKGRDAWLFNGDQVLNEFGAASSSILKNGDKYNFWETDIVNGPQIEEVHESSWEIKARVAMMDKLNVWAQIVYPNVCGFGAQKLMNLNNKQLALDILSVYNEAMAERQAESGGRFLPQALVPFWDIKAAVNEVERAKKELKLTGIAMCPEPHVMSELPDIQHRHWDPLWEVCSDLNVPINFHIGASPTGHAHSPFDDVWPSQDRYRKWVIGCALLESGQAKILANLVCGDLLERFPKTKWVSVESGIGWIPFILERIEYQLYESDPKDPALVNYDRPSPTELFKRQVYACYWFEKAGPGRLLDVIGIDNVLFESDFPHPTCLFPSPAQRAFKVLEHWGPEAQRKVMGGNAAKLYNLPL
jgi:predicted TIM-barrel fold metal-dependent hydrolase